MLLQPPDDDHAQDHAQDDENVEPVMDGMEKLKLVEDEARTSQSPAYRWRFHTLVLAILIAGSVVLTHLMPSSAPLTSVAAPAAAHSSATTPSITPLAPQGVPSTTGTAHPAPPHHPKPPPAPLDVSGTCLASCRRLGFVHVPKTGGTTVTQLYLKNAALRSLRLETVETVRGHVTAERQRERFTPAVWDSAFTLSVVRDPYDLFVSLFFFKLETACKLATVSGPQGHPKHPKLLDCSVGSGDQKHLTGNARVSCRYANALQTITDVRDPIYKFAFNEWLRENDASNFSSYTGYFGLETGRANRTPTQLSWVTERGGEDAFIASYAATGGSTIVDHIVKLGSDEYSRLASCRGLFSALCPACTDEVVASCDRQAHYSSHTNPTHHGSREDYYTPESCEIVARRFARDFEAFGYDISACPAKRV